MTDKLFNKLDHLSPEKNDLLEVNIIQLVLFVTNVVVE